MMKRMIAIVFFLHTFFGFSQTETTYLGTGIYRVSDEKTTIERYDEELQDTYFIDPNAIITIQNLDSVTVSTNGENPTLVLNFDESGRAKIADRSQKDLSKKWVVVIEDEVWIIATVRSPITEANLEINTGKRSNEEFQTIAKRLNEEISKD